MEDKPSDVRRTQGKCTIDKITRLMIDPLAAMIINLWPSLRKVRDNISKRLRRGIKEIYFMNFWDYKELDTLPIGDFPPDMWLWKNIS